MPFSVSAPLTVPFPSIFPFYPVSGSKKVGFSPIQAKKRKSPPDPKRSLLPKKTGKENIFIPPRRRNTLKKYRSGQHKKQVGTRPTCSGSYLTLGSPGCCAIGHVGATSGRPAVTPYDFARASGESEDCTPLHPHHARFDKKQVGTRPTCFMYISSICSYFFINPKVNFH